MKKSVDNVMKMIIELSIYHKGKKRNYKQLMNLKLKDGVIL
jgi:hypothetical protein